MATDLEGRTALIRGAGRGIGASIANDLADAGADVILVARSADRLDRTAAAIRATASTVSVRTVTADLSQDDDRASAVETILDGGGVDILINNAATVEPLGASTTIAPTQLRQVFDINVIAPVALSAALAPAMITAGWRRCRPGSGPRTPEGSVSGCTNASSADTMLVL